MIDDEGLRTAIATAIDALVEVAEQLPQPEAKRDDAKTATLLRLDRDLLAELKVFAVQQRRRVNDVILEAIRNHLELHGRRAA